MSGYYVLKKKTAEGMQNKFRSTRTILVGQAVRSMAVATVYSSGQAVRSMAVATVYSSGQAVRSMAVATVYSSGQALRSMAVATVYSSGTGRAVHGGSYSI